MAEEFTVQLPDGTLIKRMHTDGATDAQVRAAFKGALSKAGFAAERSSVQRPSNEDYWREKLGDQGEISNPDFDLGETLEGSLGDLLANALSERDARRIARKAFNAFNDLTPVGDAVGMERGGSEFYNGLTQGDVGRMALGAGSFALSAAPGAVSRKGEDWLRALLGDNSGAIRAWHGSPRKDLSAVSAEPPARQYDNATSRLGGFFAPSPQGAQRYAGPDGRIYETELDFQNAYEMPWSEFNYFQSPNKAADGSSAVDWAARNDELMREAGELRDRLKAAGHDGVIVRGSNGRPIEIVSFSDVPVR